MKILLVEDDLNFSNDIKHQLLLENFNIDVAYNGISAEMQMLQNSYDCILLDVNLPEKNGYEVLKTVREKGIVTPVIMITAYGEIDDKLTGFEVGADDYITKPFYFKELLARIKVFIKRTESSLPPVKNPQLADLTIDKRKKQVFRGGTLIKLTLREYDIMNILVEANGNPINKKELLQRVWGTTFEASSNTIEVFINMLRNKIDKDFEPKLIKTRIGYGYYLGMD